MLSFKGSLHPIMLKDGISCHLHTYSCFQEHVRFWNSWPSESPRNKRTKSGLTGWFEEAKRKQKGKDKITMVVCPSAEPAKKSTCSMVIGNTEERLNTALWKAIMSTRAHRSSLLCGQRMLMGQTAQIKALRCSSKRKCCGLHSVSLHKHSAHSFCWAAQNRRGKQLKQNCNTINQKLAPALTQSRITQLVTSFPHHYWAFKMFPCIL